MRRGGKWEIGSKKIYEKQSQPFDSPTSMLGLAFGVSSVERSGWTLSGALHSALKGGAWRRRRDQTQGVYEKGFLTMWVSSCRFFNSRFGFPRESSFLEWNPVGRA